ncbi:MAG: hypothetical protein JO100_04960 [Pseudonocardia sp.]|nr:hypothetical protein [Pseudonocardia sp.]
MRPISREVPKVGGYRRGSRLRTTVAGTWFPATGPDDEPAGLLLVHPAVKPSVLVRTVSRLAALNLPGVLPTLPRLVPQAGRNWLIATAAPSPTLADVLDAGPDRGPSEPHDAAAVLADVAHTLLLAHRAGLVHGAVSASAVVLGAEGTTHLTDWATDEDASQDGDLRGWSELADLLTERWCANSPAEATILRNAVYVAQRIEPEGGLAAALDALRPPAGEARRTWPAAVPSAKAEPSDQPDEPPSTEVAPAVPLDDLDDPAAVDPEPTTSTGPGPTCDALGVAPGRRRTGGWPTGRRLAMDAMMAALVLIAAVLAAHIVTAHPFTARDEQPPSIPIRPLEIRSVALHALRQASICHMMGIVSTNGEPGTVVYRWIGENGSQAVNTVSTPAYNYQVEIGLVWSASRPPLPGSSITLQILKPDSSTTSAKPEPGCG